MAAPFESNVSCYPGLLTGEDLSAKQYYLATLETDGAVDLADSAGEQCIGVIYKPPVAGVGYPISVAMPGSIVKCIAAAAIEEGALCAPDTAGKAVTIADNQYWCGAAVTPAAADGDLFSMLVMSPGYKYAP